MILSCVFVMSVLVQCDDSKCCREKASCCERMGKLVWVVVWQAGELDVKARRRPCTLRFGVRTGMPPAPGESLKTFSDDSTS